MNTLVKKFVRIFKILLPVLVMVLAIMEIRKLIYGMDMGILLYEIQQLKKRELGLILLFLLLAISPMLLYDLVLQKLLSLKIKLAELLKFSFIINTYSNILGFGGLAGLFLRNHFFTRTSVKKNNVIKNIVSVTLFYLTGLSLFSWFILIFYRDFPLLTENDWLYYALGIVGLYLPVFLIVQWIQGMNQKRSVNLKTAVMLVGVSVLEWTFMFLFILFLTNILNIPISASNLFPIFFIASSAGALSMIPGGIGSFDLVFLWGTETIGVSNETVVILLFFYRLCYFVIPFLLSTIFFIIDYLKFTSIRKR